MPHLLYPQKMHAGIVFATVVALGHSAQGLLTRGGELTKGDNISQKTPWDDLVVWHHNVHRRNHSDTPMMEWDAKVAASAKKVAETCIYEHQG
jgi:hypothetical protein